MPIVPDPGHPPVVLRCPRGHVVGHLVDGQLTVTAAAPARLVLGGDRPPAWLIRGLLAGASPAWQGWRPTRETHPLAGLPDGYRVCCVRCRVNLRPDREALAWAAQAGQRTNRRRPPRRVAVGEHCDRGGGQTSTSATSGSAPSAGPHRTVLGIAADRCDGDHGV